MNFKISVKTWIKHARKNVKNMEKQKRIDLGDDDTMSDDDDDLIEHTTFAVEIEVEKMLSETDEDEDEEEANMLIVSQSKKLSASPSSKEPMSAL